MCLFVPRLTALFRFYPLFVILFQSESMLNCEIIVIYIIVIVIHSNDSSTIANKIIRAMVFDFTICMFHIDLFTSNIQSTICIYTSFIILYFRLVVRMSAMLAEWHVITFLNGRIWSAHITMLPTGNEWSSINFNR